MRKGANIAVAIPTYSENGMRDKFWSEQFHLAHDSVKAQTVCPATVIGYHGTSLSEARNRCLTIAYRQGCKGIILLDADDRLSEGYVEHMISAPDADIKRPSVATQVVGCALEAEAMMIPLFPILTRNSFIIGCMIRPVLAIRCGGFGDLPILEDWEFFSRYLRYGQRVVDVPDAIYRATDRPDSRNKNVVLEYEWAPKIREQIRGTAEQTA